MPKKRKPRRRRVMRTPTLYPKTISTEHGQMRAWTYSPTKTGIEMDKEDLKADGYYVRVRKHGSNYVLYGKKKKGKGKRKRRK